MGDMPDYHMYVVPVNVAIPVGQTGISDIGEYDLTPEDLPDGSRGPLLLDIKGRLYVILYNSTATVEQPDQTKLKATVYQAEKDRTVDHIKVKGVSLKDPTIGASVPISIENPAIAYDSVLDLFKMALYYDGTKIDPRTIRALTASDIVTVVQPTAANLKATVTQAEKDRTITSGSVTIQEPLSVDDNAGSLTVDGTLTVVQPTAANLKATVTQAEKDRTISSHDNVVTFASGEATLSGNTEIVSVSAGKKLRIKYMAIWNNGAGSVTVALRLTSTGTLRHKKKVAAESGWMVNLIDANWEGAVDEDLFINLSDAGTISYDIGYQEI